MTEPILTSITPTVRLFQRFAAAVRRRAGRIGRSLPRLVPTVIAPEGLGSLRRRVVADASAWLRLRRTVPDAGEAAGSPAPAGPASVGREGGVPTEPVRPAATIARTPEGSAVRGAPPPVGNAAVRRLTEPGYRDSVRVRAPRLLVQPAAETRRGAAPGAAKAATPPPSPAILRRPAGPSATRPRGGTVGAAPLPASTRRARTTSKGADGASAASESPSLHQRDVGSPQEGGQAGDPRRSGRPAPAQWLEQAAPAWKWTAGAHAATDAAARPAEGDDSGSPTRGWSQPRLMDPRTAVDPPEPPAAHPATAAGESATGNETVSAFAEGRAGSARDLEWLADRVYRVILRRLQRDQHMRGR